MGRNMAAKMRVLKPVEKLDTEASIDPVGTVGGVRVYICARVARDSQFPFAPGEMADVRTLTDNEGAVGLLIMKKGRARQTKSFIVVDERDERMAKSVTEVPTEPNARPTRAAKRHEAQHVPPNKGEGNST